MPYKDQIEQTHYQLVWVNERRSAVLADYGCDVPGCDNHGRHAFKIILNAPKISYSANLKLIDNLLSRYYIVTCDEHCQERYKALNRNGGARWTTVQRDTLINWDRFPKRYSYLDRHYRKTIDSLIKRGFVVINKDNLELSDEGQIARFWLQHSPRRKYIY